MIPSYKRQRCNFLQRHGWPSAFQKPKYYILILKNALGSLLQRWHCTYIVVN
jgi:hypothetical protein